MPNHGSMGSRWKADGKQQGEKPTGPQRRPGAGVSMPDMACGSPSGPAARPPCTTIRTREEDDQLVPKKTRQLDRWMGGRGVRGLPVCWALERQNRNDELKQTELLSHHLYSTLPTGTVPSKLKQPGRILQPAIAVALCLRSSRFRA